MKSSRLKSLALVCLLTGVGSAQETPRPVQNMGGQGIGPIELQVWNDPQFRRQFALSYQAETDIEPRVTEDERRTMQRVLDLIAEDRSAEAQELLTEKGGEAASAVFDFTQANIHYQSDNLIEAKKHYQAAIQKYPKFRRAWKNLGLIQLREAGFAQAAGAFSKVIELGGNDALSFGLLGFSNSNLGQDLAAESAYRMATLLDPSTLDWKMGLARSFFRQRRFAEAVALCGSMIENDLNNAELWLLQANAFVGLGEPLRAAENYEFVDRMGGSTTASLSLLGDIYINAGLFGLGVQAYVNSLERSDSAAVQRAIRAAKVLNGNGALEETEFLLERIDHLRGDSLSAGERKDLLMLRARLALAKGAGDEEAEILMEVIRLDPLDGDALILLGQHARRNERAEQAIFYYEQAAGIEAFENRAKLRHAQLLVAESRYLEALPLLRRSLDLEPDENVRKYLEQIERLAKGR